MPKLKGMTLIEVLIAAALLALVLAGTLGIVQTGAYVSLKSTEMMLADVAAQQLIEELVGSTREEIADFLEAADPTADVINKTAVTTDNINYSLTVSFGFMGFDELAQISVSVIDSKGNDMYVLNAVVYV